MTPIRIHPLDLGKITRPKIQFYFEFAELFNTLEVPLIAWYIEGASKRILVDTGGVDPELAAHWQPYTRRAEQTIQNALGKIGVRCEDIDIVINTHLHWDHCGGNIYFPQAQFIVQEEELHSARNPLPLHAGGYLADVANASYFKPVVGDHEIVAGVKVIHTPGHTTGLQGVLVEADSTKYFISGDTVGLFACMEKEPPVVGGIYVDLRDFYTSLKNIRDLGAFVLPGHDFKVFDREVYA